MPLATILIPAQYIEIIKAFKEAKYSLQIDEVSKKIFAALKHPKFNPEVATYFEKINKNGQPFTNFELEPANITQIKKLLNALYYAHCSFKDLETIELEKDSSTALLGGMTLYSKTINSAYEASSLVTQLDVNIEEMFQEELNIFSSAWSSFRALDGKYKPILESFKKYPVHYKLGEITGVAIDQMRPRSGNLDYGFLTQFSALLPGYIDKLTQAIQKYSTQLIKKEPGLDTQEIQELKKTALTLLNNLEKFKGSNFFLPIKLIRFIRILKNIYRLVMSSLEQLGNLSESSQDMLRDILAQLKYSALPELFGLVDKIEVNCMLKPGALSIPLMEKVRPLYEAIITYSGKIVDFEAKGEELLSIEDSRFVSLRLEKTYQRINNAQKALFKIKQVEEALNKFYEIINFRTLSIDKFPDKEKKQLRELFQILRPYIEKSNDRKMVQKVNDSLLDKSGKNKKQQVLDWLTRSTAPSKASLDELKTELTRVLTKQKSTQKFQITLNTQLIESVVEETNLVLFPYSEATSAITTYQLENIESVIFPPEEPSKLYRADESWALKTAHEKTVSLDFKTKGNNKTVLDPKQLNSDQTLVLYQYYQDKLKRFTQANNAYQAFTTLLTDKIKELYPKPAHIINFDDLSEDDKKTLFNLYAQFKTYFLSSLTEELKVLAKSFDNYLSSGIQAKGFMKPPILIEFEQLDQQVTNHFVKAQEYWSNQSEFYLRQAKHKFFSEEQDVFKIDEYSALRLAGALTPNLKFIKTNGTKEVASSGLLTSDQALTLHQWYWSKCSKFEAARNAYIQFNSLIQKQLKKHPSPRGEQFIFSSLEEPTRSKCRKCYSLFQPYFIHGVPASLMQAARNFDRFLAHSLASNSTQTVEPPSTNLLHQLNDHFKTYFTKQDQLWRTKSQSYLKIAEKKFSSEIAEASLSQGSQNNRLNYVIKDTKYSEFILDSKLELQKRINFLSKPMQELLIPNCQDLPFPELEDKYKKFAQEQQVLTLKEIFNIFYHFERVLLELERLDDTSFKTMYVWHLIKAHDHITKIRELAQKLSADPHFQIIGGELIRQTQNIWATIQENLEPYQVSAEEVAPVSKIVSHNSIWYTLNAFNVIPKHLRSLRDSTFLTQKDLDELHHSAKKSTLRIEAVMNSSDSYFKLFLQTPFILILYNNLKSKMVEFINTLHDSAANHLNEISTDIFTPMLLEANQWEDKFGLKAGMISGPLQKILEEYYKELLTPLKLPSKMHIQLICNKTPINEQLRITKEKIKNATTELDNLEHTYKEVIKLHTLIKEYEKLTGGYFAAKEKTVKSLLEEIIVAYKQALPRIVTVKRKLNLKPETISVQEQKFDTTLNGELKEYETALTGIQDLVATTHAHYLGLRATHTMELQIAKEKLKYLENLSEEHNKDQEFFITEYTLKSYERQLEELTNRHLGLQYVDKEYCTRLSSYVSTFKETILSQARDTEDINLSIQEQLKAKIRNFEQDHFVKYHHLDKVRVALTQFKTYFHLANLAIKHNKSMFESDETLAEKTKLIDQLVLIAENEYLNVAERLDQIKAQVFDNPMFSGTILKQKQPNRFSFTYLKLCFLSLLEALCLYTPEKNARLKDLKKSLTQEAQFSDLTQKFGLFTSSKKSEKPKNLDSSPNEIHLAPSSLS